VCVVEFILYKNISTGSRDIFTPDFPIQMPFISHHVHFFFFFFGLVCIGLVWFGLVFVRLPSKMLEVVTVDMLFVFLALKKCSASTSDLLIVDSSYVVFI
jgi:hypothetical protein